MIRNRRLAALILSLTLLPLFPLVGDGSKAYGQVQVNFTTFYNSLSPYGNWVEVERYGPCWRPSRMQQGWQPYYTNGYWAYTDYGWTWVSRDPWGSIAYHYGSWYNDPSYGWLWVPGYNWAPAWVTWQYTDDYIGWAPLPPDYSYYDRNYGYNRYPNYSYYDRPVVVERNYYVYVPCQNMTNYNLNTVRVPVERNIEISRRARPITTINVVNNHIVNHGPEVGSIERIRRNPISINQLQRESRLEPAPVILTRERPQLEAASPEQNRREGRRVIRDLERQEREARADRDRDSNSNRQPNQERRDRAERNVQPNLDQYDVDRDRRREERQREQERSEREANLEREQRRQQREQVEAEQQQRRRQQEAQQEAEQQREREQRRAERERSRQEEERLQQERQQERRRQREQAEAEQLRHREAEEQQRQQEKEQKRAERQQRKAQAEAEQNQNRQQEQQRDQQEKEQQRQERRERRMEREQQNQRRVY